MNAANRRLATLSRDFAASVQRILNTTVCSNVRIGTVVASDPRIVAVGYGVGKSSLAAAPFPSLIAPGPRDAG